MAKYRSPLDCTLWVDVSGMPMHRAILATDVPQRPIVGLCPECGVQHRILPANAVSLK